MAVSSALDLEMVLRRVVQAAVDLVDARYGALGVIDEHRSGLQEFITVGVDEDTRRAIGAPPTGVGLLGYLTTRNRPLRLADLHEHPGRAGFPPGHPDMTSFLGVPIRIKDAVFGNLYLTDKKSGEVFTDVDEELVVGLASAAAVAIENARLFEQVRRREATLSAIQEIATALLAGEDPRGILVTIARRARELVGARLATVAMPQPGGDNLVMEVVEGEPSEGLEGAVYPVSDTLSGEVIRTGEILVTEDASTDRRWSQPQVKVGGIGPAVWLPLVADGHVFGTLSVSRPVGAHPFTDTEVELSSSFANQATIILAHDRARHQLERLTILEDQERIARELHDTVIQRIFATGMSLQGALRAIGDPLAWERVSSAVDEMDTTIRHIRGVIFGLETSPSTAQGVRTRTLELSRELQRVLGFEPQVTFVGPVDTMVSKALAEDLLATLREALSNVARHAEASVVKVEVAVGDGVVTLRVQDNGKGMPAGGPAVGAGRGLKNMTSRAEKLGGLLEVRGGKDGGTVVQWQVPAAGS